MLVFCAKHSTLHNTCAENLSVTVTNKVARNKTSSKDNEKSLANEAITGRENSDSGDLTRSEQSCEMNNGSSDVTDLMLILKKVSIYCKFCIIQYSFNSPSYSFLQLCDKGKVRVPDIASEMEIPLDLLEQILGVFILFRFAWSEISSSKDSLSFWYVLMQGQMTSVSSELKPKIIRWFQDYVHLGCPVRHTMPVESVDVGSVVVKSLPSRRRTKSDGRLLKDHKVVCPPGDPFMDEDCSVKDVSILPIYESDYANIVREILFKVAF